jgi:ABC-type ATPase involved in cell division
MFQSHTQQPSSRQEAALDQGLRPGPKLVGLQDVHVTFGDIQALRNVHFNLNRGEIVFVTGASGAGKTTLLRVIAGELDPTSGTAKRPDRRECFVSQVYQDLRILRDQTCYENLLAAFDPALYKSKKDFESDLSDLTLFLGMKSRLGLKMQDANGGLKQKVAIVRSLLTRPDLFIADEPTSSLDAENSKKIFDLLNLYNVKRGLTIVWASHNRELIRTMTGRNVHLDNGRLVYSGHACFI